MRKAEWDINGDRTEKMHLRCFPTEPTGLVERADMRERGKKQRERETVAWALSRRQWHPLKQEKPEAADYEQQRIKFYTTKFQMFTVHSSRDLKQETEPVNRRFNGGISSGDHYYELATYGQQLKEQMQINSPREARLLRMPNIEWKSTEEDADRRLKNNKKGNSGTFDTT